MTVVHNEIIESLIALGGKKDKDAIRYVADQLVIRHKKTRIEYTVRMVKLGSDSCVICYRYYSPREGGKKVFIKIKPNEFKNYEPV